MDTSKKEWWRQSAGAQQGPATAEEMKALIGSGALNGASLVWREGMPAWMPLQSTDLRDALRKEPVASPTTKTDGPDESGRWYNKKNRLWLSLLFWPLTVYGVYKTGLLEPKTKKILGIALAALLVLGLMNGDGDGDGTKPGMAAKPSWVSYFDHSVPCVERYIKRSMNDADSYESVSWDLPVKNESGTWRVRHTFRGRNMLGGKVIDTKTFIVSKDGQEVLDMY